MGQVKIGETGGISVIDFRGFLDGSQKQAVADEMLTSLKHAGFICLINHGLPKEKIEAMFEWVSVLAVCGCDPASLSHVPMISPDVSSVCLLKQRCSHPTRLAGRITEVSSKLFSNGLTNE